MSELNIKVRKSQDNGSTFRATPDTLYMGGVGSAKVDTLHFEVPEEWAGCAITLHVQRLSGALPDPQMLDENNCVVVDRRWTQEKQGSWMLLAVDENGYIAMTKPGQYTCYETIDTNSTTETITPSVYEQFVAAVEKWGQTAVDAAEKAKGSEENAADSASASADFAAAAARSKSAAEWRATKAADSASAADRAKTDAQTAAQQSEASAKKAGKALSDTITAKEDALKAIGDKQTTATQAVDTARDKALRQVESSTEAAQTAATQAVDTARDKALQQMKDSTEAAQTAATQAVDTARDKALRQVEASTEAAQTAATQAVDTARDKALRQVEASTEAAQTAATQAVDTVRDKALQQVKASTEAAQTAATQAVDTVRDKALQQMEASKAAAQTAASEAAASAGNADQSAQEAADSLQELKDGIAAGNFKGEPGNDGKSPVVTVTDIENGHRISITDKDGTKTIDVLNGKDGKDGTQIDDTTVTDSAPWSSKHIVDVLCPPLEETGNPVVCYPVSSYPLSVKASWEPTQEGSGDPSPDNVRPIKGRDSVTVERCGENLIKYPYSSSSVSRNGLVITSQQDGSITVNGTATADTWCAIGLNIEKRLPMNTPITLSGCPAGGSTKSYYIGLYLGGKWHADTGNGNTDIKFTTREIASRVEVSIIKGTVCNNSTFYPKIEVRTTITSYSKYHGQTAALTLPRTIYGGTVDAVTGNGNENTKIITLDGNELKFTKRGIYINLMDHSAPGISKNGIICCSHFDKGLFGANTNYEFCFMLESDMTSLFASVDDLNAYLAAQYAAGTPVQVAYKLAEPVPFAATGAQPIPALSGVNTVITDADSATATGRADPIKRITDLEDAVASMT